MLVRRSHSSYHRLVALLYKVSFSMKKKMKNAHLRDTTLPSAWTPSESRFVLLYQFLFSKTNEHLEGDDVAERVDAFVRAGSTTPVYFVLVSEVAVSNKSRGMEGALIMKKKRRKRKRKKMCHFVLVAVRDKSCKTEDDLFMRP